ncbi:glycosyl transferase family 1 [Pelomonas sp. HMWF004]|nr:glycosyl transferase family 1 [Pelomonas sp. HMWF004]
MTSAVPLRLAAFRTQLFKPSEPFIAEQLAALPNSQVLLLGRQTFGAADPRIASWTVASRGVWPARLAGALGWPDYYRAPIQQHRAQLIHAHFAVDAFQVLPTARRLKLPLVTTLHGFDVTTHPGHFLRSGKPSLMRFALGMKRLQTQGDQFICVSEFMRQEALKAGYPAARLQVHYMGIDPRPFTAATHDGAPEILHVARLVDKKGTAYLIDAFARLASRHPEARLTILGDGPLRSALEAQVAGHGLQARVSFAGAVAHRQVREHMARASLLALPSVTAPSGDSEGLGLVLLEAAASGLPVVGTLHGGIPEAVSNGVSGYLVPERNAEQLADAIDTLLADALLRRRMGAAGRTLVCERFDIAAQSSKLEDLYRACA